MKVCLFVLFVALLICVYVCWSWHVCVITVVPLVAGFCAVLFFGIMLVLFVIVLWCFGLVCPSHVQVHFLRFGE